MIIIEGMLLLDQIDLRILNKVYRNLVWEIYGLIVKVRKRDFLYLVM